MRKLLRSILSLIILTLIGLCTWLAIEIFFLPINSTQAPIVIVVPQGASVTQVAQQLQRQNIIRYADYLLLLARWQGKPLRIKAGEYHIQPATTLPMFLTQLTKGQVWLHKITFPEGWTFQQMLQAIQAEPTLTHTLQGQSFAQIMATLGHAGEYPEGLFFPDTYLFTAGAKDTYILRAAYNLMQRKLNQAWAARVTSVPYKNPYEALIVASLVEKETKLASERPLVAGVILKRLQLGMRLQIDAAVLYGLTDKQQRNLTYTDLRTDSAYNTYTRNGLPPTPIAMPGEAPIIAALNPVITDALYYVAKGDSSHTFSADLQDHHIATQQYRRLVRRSNNELNVAPIADSQQCVAPWLLFSRPIAPVCHPGT